MIKNFFKTIYYMISRSLFLLVAGTLIGAYISQNYNIPNVKNLIDTGIKTLTVIEKKMRKDETTENDHNDDN